MSRWTRRVLSFAWMVATAACLINIEPLDAAVYTVTNQNDSGPGSLRQAVLDCNAANDGDNTIKWSPTAGGTITLLSDLPPLTANVTIDPSAANSAVVLSGHPNFAVASSVQAVLDVSLSGDALQKEGAGTLRLNGSDSYTGGTVVDQGTLQVANQEALGAIGSNVTLNGSTLETVSAGIGEVEKAFGNAIDLQSAGGTIKTDNDPQDNFIVNDFSGAVSGTGALTKEGRGILNLSGSLTYTGGTIINDGEIHIQANGFHGDYSLANAGRLFINSPNASLTYQGTISGNGFIEIDDDNGVANFTGNMTGFTGRLAASGGTIVGTTKSLNGNFALYGGALVFDQNFDGTINGTIEGIVGNPDQYGGFYKRGSGTLRLLGYMLYMPRVFVEGGTLEGNTNSLVANIRNSATVNFNQDFDGVYADNMTGTGALVKSGTGKLTLTGANTYSGGTTIEAGTLEANTDSLQGNVRDNASLVFNQASDGTFGGAISGSGSVTKIGSGAVALTGFNSFTGGLNLNEGLVEASSDGNLGGAGNQIILNGGGLRSLTSFLATKDVNVRSGGTIDTGSNALEFGGQVTGNGNLTKQGDGELVLGRTNSFGGQVTVTEGSIRAGAKDAFGFASYALEDRPGVELNLDGYDQDIAGLSGGGASGGNVHLGTGVLSVGSASDSNFAGIIDGQGQLKKIGTGTLRLAGANTYSGGTEIDAGTLQSVNGFALPSRTNISIGGDGTLDLMSNDQTLGAMHNKGSVEIGTAHLRTRSYDGAGLLTAEIGNSSSYGQLHVDGTADVTGGELAVAIKGPYIPSRTDSFTIISADSVVGRFLAFDAPAALDFDVEYLPTSVLLRVTRGGAYELWAANENQAEIANALEAVRDNPAGDLAAVVGSLNTLKGSELPTAFESISPVAYGSLINSGFDGANAELSGIEQRFRWIESHFKDRPTSIHDARSASNATLTQLADAGSDFSDLGITDAAGANKGGETQWSFFSSVIGGTNRRGSDSEGSGNGPGYRYSSSGLITGADNAGTDHTMIGGLVGYRTGTTNLDSSFGRINSRNLTLGMYETSLFGRGLFLHGYLGGSSGTYDMERHITFGGIDRTAKSSPHGLEVDSLLSVGTNLTEGTLVVAPYAGVQYSKIWLNSFTESGADSLNLTVENQSHDSFSGTIGGRMSMPVKAGALVVTPNIRGGWLRSFDGERVIDSQLPSPVEGVFPTQIRQPDQNTGVVGAGIESNLTQRLSSSLDYTAQFGNTSTANVISANFTFNF